MEIDISYLNKDFYDKFKSVRHYKIIKKQDNDNIRYISQNPLNYENIYYGNATIIKDKNNIENIHFERYNTLKQLKDKISYAENYCVIKKESEYIEGEYKNDVNNCLNNYDNNNHLYIRFAPHPDNKLKYIKESVNANLINRNRFDINLNNEDMPVFNDNIIYSTAETDYTKTKFKEKFNNE